MARNSGNATPTCAARSGKCCRCATGFRISIVGLPACAGSNPTPGPTLISWRYTSLTRRLAVTSSSSTRWPIGPAKPSGNTSRTKRSPTIHCTTRVTVPSAAGPAPRRRPTAKTSGRAGGLASTKSNAASTRSCPRKWISRSDFVKPPWLNPPASVANEPTMDQLSKLENQSIYILREAFNKFEHLAMLWSIGKDSTVLLWLARKAFFGHVPFPLVHVDTSYKIPSMIEYRDRLCREWNLQLVVGRNEAVLKSGVTYPNGKATRVECCGTLKKDGLKQVLDQHHFTGVIVGVRRDEEPTRAKERYFSPRDKNMEWNVEDQPPELWDQFKTDYDKGTHIRIHPLLHWTELNIWEYIERESIPVIPLYFANEKGERYRSIGCAPCTFPIKSNAKTVRDIIEELRHTRTSERSGRAQDQESEDAFEKLRRDGYM